MRTLRLRFVRWMACSALRTVSRVMVSCMVPVASIPHDSSWSPTISRPSTRGRALLAPDVVLERRGAGRAGVGADEPERRPRPGHDNAGGAVADQGDESDPVEVDDDGFGEPIDALAEADAAGP